MEANLSDIVPLVERRRFPRLKCASPIQYRDVFKPHELFFGCLSRDLSAGGLRMTASKILPSDARLVVLLSLPDSLRQIRSITRVTWQRHLPRGTAYDYGLQFIEITAEDQEAISDFVERGVVVNSTQSSTPNPREMAV